MVAEARLLDAFRAIADHHEAISQEFRALALELGDRDSGSTLKVNLERLREIKIKDLELSVRSSNCLRREGIVTVGDLVSRSPAELLRMEYFGRGSLNEIRQVLFDLGVPWPHLSNKPIVKAEP